MFVFAVICFILLLLHVEYFPEIASQNITLQSMCIRVCTQNDYIATLSYS